MDERKKEWTEREGNKKKTKRNEGCKMNMREEEKIHEGERIQRIGKKKKRKQKKKEEERRRMAI